MMIRKWRTGLYLIVVASMIAYAVPRLEFGSSWTLATAFSAVWLGFALLVLASMLHRLLGVNEQTAKDLDQLRKLRRVQLQQWMLGQKTNVLYQQARAKDR